MRIEDHLLKAHRIENTMLQKLDATEDYELYVETFMLAGTHFLNAVLHRSEITDEAHDLLHSYLPKLDKAVGSEASDIMTALKYIEDLRPQYLRGRTPWDPRDGEKCLSNYRAIKQIAQRFLERGVA